MKGPKPRPIEERFWPKVNKTEGCWLWMAGTNGAGYGVISRGGHDGGIILAHRLSLALSGVALDPSLEVDHLCRNPLCVNPAHLEQVTSLENTRRGNHSIGVVYRTGACMKGHVLTPENRYGKEGRCRKCLYENNEKYRLKHWDKVYARRRKAILEKAK